MNKMLSNLIITKVFSAATMYNEENTKKIRKNRPCWAVVIKYEGETVYYQGNKKIVSNVNNMVILPKSCDYEWHCTKAGHFSIIEFDCDMCSSDILNFPIKNGEKILKIFKSLEYKRLTKQPLYALESIKETYSIILKLLSQSNEIYVSHQKTEKLFPAIDYISKNYNQDIRNDYLAELTGFSTVYFRKLFTEVYGISPINYIKNARIKKAKEMLHSDYSSITDIAISLGYSNIYDFSRDFKKQTGISPTQYAKQIII